jgi:hypothetical protein
MRVCGIDLSTHAIDLVLVDQDTDTLEWHRCLLQGQDPWERTRSVRQAMPAPTGELWDDVIAIAVEDPRGYAAGRLFRIQGALLACLPNATLIHPYVPARWRVLAGLKGHALKSEITEHSIRLGGLEQWPQDGHDAHLIARAMLADLAAQKQAA